MVKGMIPQVEVMRGHPLPAGTALAGMVTTTYSRQAVIPTASGLMSRIFAVHGVER